MSNHFIDSLRGIDTLEAFGRSRDHAGRIFAVSERFREATMKTLRIATLSSAVLDTFATLALAAVAIMMGFRLVEGTLSFFRRSRSSSWFPSLRPIREFASDYHASLDGRTSLAAIRETIDEARALRPQERTRPRSFFGDLETPSVALETFFIHMRATRPSTASPFRQKPLQSRNHWRKRIGKNNASEPPERVFRPKLK